MAGLGGVAGVWLSLSAPEDDSGCPGGLSFSVYLKHPGSGNWQFCNQSPGTGYAIG